jgi:SAM-dependent methyltransferase
MLGNQNIFEDRKVIAYYAQDLDLTDAESLIFRRYRTDYVDNRRVLDVGVGTGRTVPSFAPNAAHYVGIDYSYRMIDICKARFSHYRIEHGDARDLARFNSGSFDCVLFSYNGIDMVDHTDRQVVLGEVSRVLTVGGIFIFSSHNLQWGLKQPLWRSLVQVGVPRTPVQAIKRLARIGLRGRNYLRYRHTQTRTEDYAVILDPGHDFTLPIYHVDPLAQRKQLWQNGFDAPTLFAEQHAHSYDEQNPYSYYYVARKRQL